MTLFKQMATIFTVFLVIILLSVMALNFKTATEFVQNDLHSNAKNTAHSLGLSLSKLSIPEDTAGIETTVNAIFDSGYYERIALIDLEGKALYVREVNVQVEDVPQWFIDNVTIQNAHASSDIMIGWQRLGSLEVSGHTGNAYRQLYHTLIDLMWTFFGLGVFVLAILYLLLSLSLQSLKQIQKQAQGIIENCFIVETRMPFTTEFRSATVAMNAMVCKVRDIFDRENETLLRYQDLLYKDSETKLYNRRYLIAKLPEYLQGDSTLSEGLHVMLSIDELDRYKKEFGYESYLDLIKKVVKGLQECMKSHTFTLMTRLNESDFFLLIPQAESSAFKEKIDAMLHSLRIDMDKEVLNYLLIGVGIGTYNNQDTLKSLLSRLDFMVAQAKQNGNFCSLIETRAHHALVLSREEWREEIVKALAQERIILASQNVMKYEQESISVVHKEFFVRLKKDDKVHSAGVFIPIAAALGLADEIDRYMIEAVVKNRMKVSLGAPVAINLSAEFIGKYTNMQWLKGFLERLDANQRIDLWFEVSNTIVLHHFEAIIALSATLKTLGHKFGIDSFTIPEEGAFYLQAVRPDYVKSTAQYLEDMMLDDYTGKNQESLTNLTRSLGISIIATNIESERELIVLKESGIIHFQGTYIAPIELIEDKG